MDHVQKSQELCSDIVIVVHYLKILDEDRWLFCFDEKGSNILLEAKEVLTKLKGTCNRGIISLPGFNSGVALPISGKKSRDKIMSMLGEDNIIYDLEDVFRAEPYKKLHTSTTEGDTVEQQNGEYGKLD